MRRDMDLMRKALLAIETLPPTSNSELTIAGYDRLVLNEHVGQLFADKYVTAHTAETRSGTFYFSLKLAPKGHELLDSIRDDVVWEKVKALSLQRTGCVTFESIRRALADLWVTVAEENVLSATASSASLDNSPFTAAEQLLIATRLNEIKTYLLEGQQFAAEQAKFIERRFEYFMESSTRMGRKDWLNVLFPGLFTVIVGVALAPDAARLLLRLAATAFQSLWGMAQGLLQ
jgi:hypothetical protein